MVDPARIIEELNRAKVDYVVENFEAASASATVCSYQGVPVRILNLPALNVAKEAANDPIPRKQSALAYLRDLLKTRGGS